MGKPAATASSAARITKSRAQAAATADRIGELVAAQVDLDRVLAVAGSHPTLTRVQHTGPDRIAPAADLRLGIARDPAFGFYYPGDLEALRAGGAELVTIDTLRDSALPDVDGLFLGGGFPEMHMGELEANAELRTAIRRAVEAGWQIGQIAPLGNDQIESV